MVWMMKFDLNKEKKKKVTGKMVLARQKRPMGRGEDVTERVRVRWRAE